MCLQQSKAHSHYTACAQKRALQHWQQLTAQRKAQYGQRVILSKLSSSLAKSRQPSAIPSQASYCDEAVCCLLSSGLALRFSTLSTRTVMARNASMPSLFSLIACTIIIRLLVACNLKVHNGAQDDVRLRSCSEQLQWGNLLSTARDQVVALLPSARLQHPHTGCVSCDFAVSKVQPRCIPAPMSSEGPFMSDQGLT